MASSTSRSKNSTLNMSFSLLFQLITAISGLILPKLIIENFGSDVNGLIASITQFLSYISLLEAGAEGVIRASLYKPLSIGDTEKVSGIVVAAKKFYFRIAMIFLIYLAGMCIIYPLIAKTNFDFLYIVSMILILSVGTIMQYLVGLYYSTLITADQKSRIISIVNIIAVIANIAVTYVLILCGMNIHIVKIVSCLIFAGKPVFLMLYAKSHYQLNMKAAPDNNAIKQRWNGLVHHIAYFIHINTDIALITMFLNTKYVSVYSLYYAVVVGIEKIVTSISGGSAASFGNLIATESKKYVNDTFDKFEFIQASVTTILFTITGILIVPFMQVYTINITDVNYIYPEFAYIMVIAEALYCIRCIYSTVSLASGRYKQTQLFAISEAIVNLAVSIVLIQYIGLIGIAIGTFLGMLTRTVLDMIYLSKNVLERSIFKFLKVLLVNISISTCAILICGLAIPFSVTSWGGWIAYAVIVSVITALIALTFYLIFYREILKSIFKRYFGKNQKSKR